MGIDNELFIELSLFLALGNKPNDRAMPTHRVILLGKDLTGLFCYIKSLLMTRCSTKDARSCQYPSGLFIEKAWNDGHVCGQDGIFIELSLFFALGKKANDRAMPILQS